MFGPRLSHVFKSRWHALLWSAGVLATAYCSIPTPESGEGGAGAQASGQAAADAADAADAAQVRQVAGAWSAVIKGR